MVLVTITGRAGIRDCLQEGAFVLDSNEKTLFQHGLSGDDLEQRRDAVGIPGLGQGFWSL